MTWAMLVPRKVTEFPWIANRAAKFVDQLLKRWQAKSDKLAKKEVRLFQRDRQWEKASPMGSLSALWDSLPVRSEH